MQTCDYCEQERRILLRHPAITGSYCVCCKDTYNLPETTPERMTHANIQ